MITDSIGCLIFLFASHRFDDIVICQRRCGQRRRWTDSKTGFGVSSDVTLMIRFDVVVIVDPTGQIVHSGEMAFTIHFFSKLSDAGTCTLVYRADVSWAITRKANWREAKWKFVNHDNAVGGKRDTNFFDRRKFFSHVSFGWRQKIKKKERERNGH